LRMLIGAAIGLLAGGLWGHLSKRLGQPRARLGRRPIEPLLGAIAGAILALILFDSAGKASASSHHIEIIRSVDQFEQVVLQAGKPVLVDFYATWCAPCRALEPVFDSLAKDYVPRAGFARVDVDKRRDLAGRYGVSYIPTVILFVDGQKTHRLVGVRTEDEYKRLIDNALAQ
jgi:thioredoxin 1